MAMLKAPPTPRDHRRGAADAPVVLVEYGDYQCPHCAAAEPVVEGLLRAFERDVQLVFRHFPLSQVHPFAEVAAQTAEFAGERGSFWPMHGSLFANQRQLSLPVMFALAGALNLPQQALREALERGRHVGKVREDFIGGVRSGVNGTPSFFVNGVRHDGGYTASELSAAIRAARAARAAAGAQPAPSLHAG